MLIGTSTKDAKKIETLLVTVKPKINTWSKQVRKVKIFLVVLTQ